MTLPAEWMQLLQPETFFVQQRAINAQSNIALSAGAFKMDLPVKYVSSHSELQARLAAPRDCWARAQN